MKKVLQFSGIIAFVLGLVGFILLMATPAIAYSDSDATVRGTLAIFGGAEKIWGAIAVTYKPSPLALIGWILALVGLIVICLGVVLPLLKVKGVEKFAGLMNLVAVVLLVLAGVFAFIVVPTWYSANELGDPNNAKALLGAGWIIGGILLIAGGAFAILPAVMDFVGKKKK